jgi:branched-chain amino acid transport system permease protein
MMAMYQFRALPSNYVTVIGLVWFAVAATMGMRSIPAALFAGITFAVFPQIIADHLSQQWQTLPTALFGLGAIAVARHPDGVVAMHAAQGRWIKRRVTRLVRHLRPVHEPAATEAPAA